MKLIGGIDTARTRFVKAMEAGLREECLRSFRMGPPLSGHFYFWGADAMKTLGTLHPTEVPASPDYVQQAVLVANTGQAFDVPTGAGFVVFGSNVDFFARYGSTAASVPTTSSTGSSTNAEMNPTARNIGSTQSCTGVSVISAAAGIVTMAWYKP